MMVFTNSLENLAMHLLNKQLICRWAETTWHSYAVIGMDWQRSYNDQSRGICVAWGYVWHMRHSTYVGNDVTWTDKIRLLPPSTVPSPSLPPSSFVVGDSEGIPTYTMAKSENNSLYLSRLSGVMLGFQIFGVTFFITTMRYGYF